MRKHALQNTYNISLLSISVLAVCQFIISPGQHKECVPRDGNEVRVAAETHCLLELDLELDQRIRQVRVLSAMCRMGTPRGQVPNLQAFCQTNLLLDTEIGFITR